MKPNRRTAKKIAHSLLVASACFLSAPTFAAEAVFAGGCFWCVEKDFEKLEGVSEAISGFTGGTAENPTYSGDHTGHYEAVKIIYDPDVVSYQELLNHFWVNHDPFDASLMQTVERFPDQKVITPILPLGTFYPIKGKESYHQDYYKNNPVRYNAYRYACGRDKRLKEIWGTDATV